MPFDDPEDVTVKYMQEHNVTALFEDLLAFLMFSKPDDPKKALISRLENMKAEGQGVPMINADDLRAMFGMFDITHREVISVAQANAALKTVLGPDADITSESLWGSETKMMKKDDFVKYMGKALQEAVPMR
mmetsp:Transcript_6805/g.17374  ORF Transcript_6805/g.17374 Transcript_6805/m.17374 type:complete len:132 (-) Transcript_6805:264-659(-)|eukprot:jgi/Tetstr1/441784/TSEL_030001.t1